MKDLEDFKITKELTPELAVSKFGKPDKELGSGFIIYVYLLSDGHELILRFPGFRPILSATVWDGIDAESAQELHLL